MEDIYSFLHFKPVTRIEHFSFNLLNFYFFKNNEWIDSFWGAPIYLCPQLTVIPYVLAMEVILFRAKRHFVELNKRVVGIFALLEKPEALYISSLAIAPEYRRLGIATHIINYASKRAKRLGKKWLELSVLKTNIPALRLYKKLGFTKKKEKKWGFILRKSVKIY